MNNLMMAPRDQALVLHGLTLLVVDDDSDTRVLLSFLLQEAGATVIAADAIEEAIALLEEHQPDILISDVLMAGEQGGFDLVHRVLTLEAAQQKRILAIAVTGLASDGDREQILHEGFHHLIKKPIDVDRFPTEVATLYKTLIASPQ
jgi:two-component system, OmpR family, response regulator